MDSPSLFPCASKEELVKEYVGKSLHDVPCPAVVLDLSKLKRNCASMLEAVDSLNCGWRAHIKTHKTTELTSLQVGDGSGPANIVVSTVIEAENIVPLLLEYKNKGRAVNVLYSFPLTSGVVDRLSKVSTALGPNGLSLMIDHPSQLRSVAAIHTKTNIPPLIFVKIDMGGHRAGVIPVALQTAALDYLRQEFEALLVTSEEVHSAAASKLPLVLSVGATPTSSAIRNLLLPTTSVESTNEIAALKATIGAIRDAGCEIEIHAGVYPMLDMQQLATHALPEDILSWSSVAITILAEVACLYPSRGESGSPEALITAGSLAIGREPCKAYPGWGILSPWNRTSFALPNTGPEGYSGWQISRISQEHVRIWPNHACIAGAGYGWYLIVDGDGKEDEVVDVWVRWRGW
ncbi:hypothetical protein EYC84_004376 [Monilinia fructicola]|uniref:D-serine dehydratase-like domain-containing protein n=1 Tax=Monilinia fructicola TaxID=38448 RepID=A0A5M9K052_MONFR|nr:hypothetical protein EYC84_004376 [Monilinia fructicola]